jgi:hypothetical protein
MPLLRKERAPEIVEIPQEVAGRMKRGHDAMLDGAPLRNECLRFARGKQYTWVDSTNALREQATTNNYEGRGGKARHRVRSVRNYIFDHVETEVAAATQRVPGYDIAPTSTEPKRVSAARLARQLAYYGYEQWNVRKATERVVRFAVVADEGFAWPYFDTSVGPFRKMSVRDPKTNEPTGEFRMVGEGEVKIRVLGPNEVFWEPGVEFAESRWYGVEQALDLESVKEMEGVIEGVKIVPDAQLAETSEPDKGQEELVLVKHYLERPSRRRPRGRWITIANGQVIIPERAYPCRDADGKTLDEPVLHQLYYAEDPDSDRNQGLVRHLIPAQRQLNHAVSKISEWVNLMMNPQLIIRNGKLKSGKLNDIPGAVVRVVGSGEVKLREVPSIPPELFQQKEEAISDMARLSAQNDIPSQVESGKGIQYLIEKDSSRRSGFFANLAQFHSRLMRHCLYLVQRHYSEPRLIKVRGERGVDPIPDFLGASLLGEVDVRVTAGSLEPRTREQIEAKILSFADRGWISSHEAMAAINTGTAEGLVQSYERDIARANLVIQRIKEGPEVFLKLSPRRPFYGEDPGFNEETGLEREYIPGWMPRPFDNIFVHRDVFSDWMKSSEYDDLEAPEQEAANAYYDALMQLEAKQRAQQAEAQQEIAESLGSANAAKPQAPAPTPDQAAVNQR